MGDQSKDHIGPKRPKQRNCPPKLQTHKQPTDDVENINSISKAWDLLFADKSQVIPCGAQRMLQSIKRHSRVTLLYTS